MLDPDKDRFGRSFDLLTAGYKFDSIARAKAAYFEALSDIDIHAVESAARILAASWTRRQGCPLPGDWREACNANAQPQPAGLQRRWDDDWALRINEKGQYYAKRRSA